MNKAVINVNNFIVNGDIDVLQEKIQNLPMGDYDGVVLEVLNDDFEAHNLPLLIENFFQKQLVVIGIRTENSKLKEFAQFSNLAIFAENQENQEIQSQKNTQTIQNAPSIVRENTKRNEQVYAKNCDLVLLGDLHAEAEAMSDESVSIYGGGYGSVFAGINNKNSSIFVNYFQLKLVCIAGVYKKFDTIPENLFNKSVVITLNNGKLNFKPI